MLTIGNTYLRQDGSRAFLCAGVTLDGKTSEAFFSVEPEYSRYLTTERSDAFVVGFLTTAMRMGCDICCQTPMTKRLHYQLTQYLIPAMAKNMDIYHQISIHAPLADDKLPCEGAVGTGWTGGVDSMYTLMHHTEPNNSGYPLTHLLIANNGALESDRNQELLAYMVNKTRTGIAAELGLKVVGVDTNLHLLQTEAYLAVASFRLSAVVLAVQKLFGVFLNSAGYEFATFAYVPENSAYYELVTLQYLETDCTVFYSSGGAASRIQKLEALSSYPLAQKNLHPCIDMMRDNCGKCGKCVRTQAALYALGKLELFCDVFPVDDFYENKDLYLAQIVLRQKSQHYREVLTQLEKRGIPISDKTLHKAKMLKAVEKVARQRQEQK